MRFEQIIPLYDDQPIAKRFATQDTRFEVTEGNIHALISETELVELINSGKTMYSGMNDIRVDISGLTANISSLSTAVDANTGNITSLDSRMTSYSATLDGLSADLESTKSNLNQTNSRVASLQLSQDTFATQLSATNTNLSNNYYTKTQVDTKADTAESNAISAAASDATTKANTAQANAIRTAASDATTKANQAIAAANSATDEKLVNYSTIESTSSAINQSANSILSTVSETYSTKTEAQTYAQNAQNSANSATDTKLKSYSTTSQMNSAIEQSAGNITSSVAETYATKTESKNYVDNTLKSYSTTAQMNSAISQSASSITSTVSQTYATKTEAQSMATSAENNAKIYADGKVSTAQSEITQTTNAISLRVTNNTTNISSHTDSINSHTSSINSINNTLTSLDTRLDVYDNSIVATVAENGLISTINQTAGSVKIDASKIDLTGYVTLSALSTAGKTTINGSNIKTGTISANRILGGTLRLGVVGSSSGALEVFRGDGNKYARLSGYGFWFGPDLPTASSAVGSDYNNAANFRVTPNGYVYGNNFTIKTGSYRNTKAGTVLMDSTGFSAKNSAVDVEILSYDWKERISDTEYDNQEDEPYEEDPPMFRWFYPHHPQSGLVVSTHSEVESEFEYTHIGRWATISTYGLFADNWQQSTAYMAQYTAQGFKLCYPLNFLNDVSPTTLSNDVSWCRATTGSTMSGCRFVVVDGAKNKLVNTKDYGKRFLYSYETPTPYFGDIGEGIVGKDDLCYINIDPAFAETIETDQYQVFLQKYGDGDCWIKERKADYFVVQGTPDLAFAWEIKAKQTGWSQYRLDKEWSEDTIERDETSYRAEATKYLQSISIDYAAEAEQHIEDLTEERRIPA